MGGCTSTPKEFDSQAAPLPAEIPSSPKDAKGETVPQENNNGGEPKKEEPLVDLSEPIPEAPKVEDTSTETKTAEAIVVYDESKPTETSEVASKPTEEKVEAKEVAKEEKKEVVEVVATKAEDKNDAPLIEV